MWAGLVLVSLLLCARGLAADGKDRSKAGVSGRVSTNAAAANTIETRAARSQRKNPPVLHSGAESTSADSPPGSTETPGLPAGFQPEQLIAPGGLGGTVNLMMVMTVLSLAPSILIMTTCFIRFIIVTSLLRQALGTQQLPPNNVLVALCL
ncbi:MAG: flagellar biosynthetic protein FliP, partial [Planctomycetes bacterium]|nr:flagellar biosynthetic protein FliP [Planctomycetota bacterium]